MEGWFGLVLILLVGGGFAAGNIFLSQFLGPSKPSAEKSAPYECGMINNEHWQEHQRPEDIPRFLEDLRRRGLSALSGCHLVPAGEREPR